MVRAAGLDGATVFDLPRQIGVGLEFVVGEKDGKPTLTIRDGQHEYVFTPA